MLRATLRSWLLVVGLASLAGCSAGGAPNESVGRADEALFANDEAAFDYFLGKGLENFQAAGIVGNLDQESGVDPLAVQSGGPGRGIAQWSVGGRWDSDPNDNAMWFANQEGQSVDSLQLQLDFIWYELTTYPTFGLASLQASTDVNDATTVFQDKFEICGACDSSQRIGYANDVLSAYGNDTAPDGGAVDAGAPSCSVPGVGDGVCIATSDCAAMPGYVSTPGYCPGPVDEECCTGPMGATSATTGAGGASSSSGPTGSGSGGALQTSTSSGGASTSGSGGASTSSSPGSLSGNPVADDAGPMTGSCATAPSEGGGSPSSFAWLGFAAVFLRRRAKTKTKTKR